jgi:hypothetical protein
MAIRIYISPLVKFDHAQYPGKDYYSSAAMQVWIANAPHIDGESIRHIVPKWNSNGTARKSWVLAIVDVADHTPFLADNRLRPMPVKGVDAVFTGGERNSLVARMEENGMTVSVAPNTIREAVRMIVRHIMEDDTLTERVAGL